MTNSKLYVKQDCAIWRNNKGQYHREDGPAFINDIGSKFWLLNGKRHREDGPAIVYSTGIKVWYLNGDQYSEEEYLDEICR